MKTAKPIAAGTVIVTVGPTGKPNGHTARIGRGRVVSLHTETDGRDGMPKPYAYVCFFDGKRGSWPVDQLRAC